jgi:uncharacterized membrane protein
MFNNIKNAINRRIKALKQSEKYIFGTKLAKIVIMYGLIINFVLWSVFGLKFNIFTVFGYGFLYYLIANEFLAIILNILQAFKPFGYNQ